MTRRRHTHDQIIGKLAEGNKLLAGGGKLDEVCRHLEITGERRPRTTDAATPIPAQNT